MTREQLVKRVKRRQRKHMKKGLTELRKKALFQALDDFLKGMQND